MRYLFTVALFLAFFVSVGESADNEKKKGTREPITGKVIDVDIEEGIIHMVVVTAERKKEKQSLDTNVKVSEDTKVIINGKEFTGPEGLKNVKEGNTATVTFDGEFKAVTVKIEAASTKKKK